MMLLDNSVLRMNLLYLFEIGQWGHRLSIIKWFAIHGIKEGCYFSHIVYVL